jgi:tetratricopeptide (TPR) repeat protein
MMLVKLANKTCMVGVGILSFLALALGQSFEAGKAALVAKDFPEAIKQFKLAAEKDPLQDVIWANLGRAYDAGKQYDAAIEAYQKAIAIKASESNYFLNLSLAQLAAGKIDDSTDSIRKAGALNPRNPNYGSAYFQLGQTLAYLGNVGEALDYLKKCINLGAGCPDATKAKDLVDTLNAQ